MDELHLGIVSYEKLIALAALTPAEFKTILQKSSWEEYSQFCHKVQKAGKWSEFWTAMIKVYKEMDEMRVRLHKIMNMREKGIDPYPIVRGGLVMHPNLEPDKEYLDFLRVQYLERYIEGLEREIEEEKQILQQKKEELRNLWNEGGIKNNAKYYMGND